MDIHVQSNESGNGLRWDAFDVSAGFSRCHIIAQVIFMDAFERTQVKGMVLKYYPGKTDFQEHYLKTNLP